MFTAIAAIATPQIPLQNEPDSGLVELKKAVTSASRIRNRRVRMASLLRAVDVYRPVVAKAPPAPVSTPASQPAALATADRTPVLLWLAGLAAIMGPIFVRLSYRRKLAEATALHQSGLVKLNRAVDFINDAGVAADHLAARLSADIPPQPVVVPAPPPQPQFDTTGVIKILTGATGQIVALNTASLEIGHLSEGIRGISFRTNMLSLNASIEAAHAGDRGAGFGIVASEVKDMAAMVRESAEEIAGRVAAIQLRLETLTKTINSAADGLEVLPPPALPAQPVAPVIVARPSIAPEIAGKLSALADDMAAFTGKPVPVLVPGPQPNRHSRRNIK